MTPSFNYGVSIVAYNTHKHHRINFTFPQHEFTIRQILIYHSTLSPVSLLYYKGTGLSPYPFVGRGFTPAAFFDSRHSLRREPICKQMRPTLRDYPHYNTNLQRKQVLCRNSFVADSRGRLSLRCKHPYENEPKGGFFLMVLLYWIFQILM